MLPSGNDLVTGLVVSSKGGEPDPICEACLAGKMTSAPFPTSTRQSLAPLELVHSDLHGPLSVPSPEGYRYWITFLDDCTKLHAVHFLKRKSDVFDAFKTFKAYAEKGWGLCGRCLCPCLESPPYVTSAWYNTLHYLVQQETGH
jgi:hypothetical protein